MTGRESKNVGSFRERREQLRENGMQTLQVNVCLSVFDFKHGLSSETYK